MNTRFLMMASAIFFGGMGAAASFLPVEILTFLDPGHNRALATVVQLLGAALIGFGMLNWMARGAPAGGIAPLGQFANPREPPSFSTRTRSFRDLGAGILAFELHAAITQR